MPEVVIARCDAPKCPNIGTVFVIKSDKGGEKKVIVCDDHQQESFKTVLGWSRPNAASRRRTPRTSSIEDRLLSIQVDD